MPVTTFRRPIETPTQTGAEPSPTQGATFAMPALPSSGHIPRRFTATPAGSQGGDASGSQTNHHLSQSQYRRRKNREATRLRQKESRKYVPPL
jgi:hypothetical protein